MHYYDNTYVYVNDRPVGYVADLDEKDLQKHGFQKIGADFNTQSGILIPVVAEKPAAAPARPHVIPTVEL